MYKVFFDDVKCCEINKEIISAINGNLSKTKFYQIKERRKLKDEKIRATMRLKYYRKNIFLKLSMLSTEELMTILSNMPAFEIKAYSFFIPNSLNCENTVIEKVEVYDRKNRALITTRYDWYYENNDPLSTTLNTYQIYNCLNESKTLPANLHNIIAMDVVLAIKEYVVNPGLYEIMIDGIIKYISKKLTNNYMD